MKERPILFRGEMVRAILAGQKTQTRRLVKFCKLHSDYGQPEPDRCYGDGAPDCRYLHVAYDGAGMESMVTWHRHYAPYGVPGDRLWVKETWGEVSHIDDCNPRRFAFVHIMGPDERCIIYREEAEREGFEWADNSPEDRWRPSIHMPRWASRLLLQVVAVRAERLQNISAADALAEGVLYADIDQQALPPRARYALLWDKIHGKGAWDANPWVWVVEFKRVELPEATA
jgi:hypothetical protein